MAKHTLGAILYPGFELLDLFGPLEMFGSLEPDEMDILTIAENAGPVASSTVTRQAGPEAVATFGFSDAPACDMLLVPGGVGTIPMLEDEALLTFLKERADDAAIVASVCTGSAILARAGLLDGHRATSNKQFFDLARGQSDAVEWVERARWVEDGKFLTSSGVSAGMDMALAIIALLFGEGRARDIADATEYSWHRDASEDPFANQLNSLMKG